MNFDKPINKEELLSKIKEDVRKIYSKRRMTLQDDLFLVGQGINPDTKKAFAKISGEIGRYFDAHGIVKTNQLTQLLNLLEKGIDQSKPFYTAPFELPDKMRPAGSVMGTSGGTAYKDGLAVITSGYKEKLTEQGIKHVFINDLYAEIKDPLVKLFPQYQFHLLSEQKTALKKNNK